MFRLLREYYDVPDKTSAGGSKPVTQDIFSKQDIFDALSDDKTDDKTDEKLDIKVDEEDDKSDKKDKKEDKTDKKSTKETKETKEATPEDDLDELEKELAEDEEPDDEKLELVTPVRRKEILKKYPTLFEDFPYLERAYYREQQFTEIYPTLDDAREALSSAQTLESFEQDLSAGNTEKLLLGVKQASPNGFNKLVDNYLNVLQKVDEKAYTHVIGNVISHTIYNMVQEANASQRDELKNAAQILNNYIFGTSKYVPPSKLTTEDTPDPRASELEQQKREFLKQRFDVASDELKTKVGNLFKSTISQHIDPKNSMPPYVRKNAEREAYEVVNELLVSDKRFRTIVDTLWEKAARANFSPTAMNELRKAFLGRGKSLLPTAIKKARLNALSGMKVSTNVIDDKDDKETKTEKSRNVDRSQSKSSSDKYKGMSTLEALMADD